MREAARDVPRGRQDHWRGVVRKRNRAVHDDSNGSIKTAELVLVMKATQTKSKMERKIMGHYREFCTGVSEKPWTKERGMVVTGTGRI